VAHEINNPLAFVTNNLVVLRREVSWMHDMLCLYQQAEETLALYQGELYTRISQLAEDVDLSELAAERGPSESVEDLVARQELSAIVEEAMALLPEEQRTAVILKEYHGMTFQEIADLQGCPLSTVKTRLYQGLSVLRKHLKDRSLMPPAGQAVRVREH